MAKPKQPPSPEPLERLIDAARRHGELSEPDHEIGDLQAILRACWQRLTPAQAREIFDEHQDLITDWE